MQAHDGVDYDGVKYQYNSLFNAWNNYKFLGDFLPFEPNGILNIWDHLVRQSTQRQLMYDSDRLAALSGIAKKMHNTGALSRYYAGLWEARLHEALLWFVNPNKKIFNPLPPGSGTSNALTWP